MKHDWRDVSWREGKQPFHPLQRVRECRNCGIRQGQQTRYDFGSYSNRGGPKVRGYTWSPKAGRCK